MLSHVMSEVCVIEPYSPTIYSVLPVDPLYVSVAHLQLPPDPRPPWLSSPNIKGNTGGGNK